MQAFKSFILDNVRSQYGRGTLYEYPIVIGSLTILFATAAAIAVLITRSEERRLREQEENDKKEKIFSTSNGIRTITCPLTTTQEWTRRVMSEARQNFGFFTTPILIVKNFILVLQETAVWILSSLVSSPIIKFIIIPAVWLWCLGSMYQGPHSIYCEWVQFAVEFVIWWVGLGVLSSVGLGSGMHSGLIFLFPHIFNVAVTANQCGHTHFNSFADMWFRTPSIAFQCLTPPTDPINLTFLSIVLKAILPAMLWGAGTAIGEIPPYAISRAATLAGQRTADMEEVLAARDMGKNNNAQNGATTQQSSSLSFTDRMKVWMLDFIEKWGFWGIVLFSAWPNAFFDLCGICCGMFLMPFWTFFIATFIGKAVIKVNMQLLGMVAIFSQKHVSLVLVFLKKYLHSGIFTPVEKAINEFSQNMAKTRTSAVVTAVVGDAASTTTTATSVADATAKTIEQIPFAQLAPFEMAKYVFQLFMGWGMYLLIGWFVVSTIKQFALNKLQDLDEEALANKIRKERDQIRRHDGKYAFQHEDPIEMARKHFLEQRQQQLQQSLQQQLSSPPSTATRPIPTSPKAITPTKHIQSKSESSSRRQSVKQTVAAATAASEQLFDSSASDNSDSDSVVPKRGQSKKPAASKSTAAVPTPSVRRRSRAQKSTSDEDDDSNTKETFSTPSRPQSSRRTSVSRRKTVTTAVPEQRKSPHLHENGVMPQSTKDWINKRKSIVKKQ